MKLTFPLSAILLWIARCAEPGCYEQREGGPTLSRSHRAEVSERYLVSCRSPPPPRGHRRGVEPLYLTVTSSKIQWCGCRLLNQRMLAVHSPSRILSWVLCGAVRARAA
ncbi:hypothetical protein LshimejAT787_0805450 [Lyophyllum shimeji]|uniref:Secreted protein n=1 Tax=Lyophyllum shimeji TaxID=47721 RepID=A0A9P3UMP5_LYOSH|nr:hypothetical protein LshimejAT787_0805450 [Lyophyllum shimeji]